jgi:glutamate-1-semialdehyde 2,1-aminomutase
MTKVNNILETETEKYKARTRRSEEIYVRAKKVSPYGVNSNYRFTDPYPVYGKSARGSRIWDADENEYLDFNMGFGALVSGHAHPELVAGLSERIASGALLGLEFEDSDTLASLINERFGTDLVRFSSTGLEATMHAIRFARAFTGRSKILKFEGCYHGSHDTVLVSVKPKRGRAGSARHPVPVPASLGVLRGIVDNTIIAPFNDLEAVEEVVEKNENDFAGMILEPVPMNMGLVLPDDGFLQGLRKICDRNNAVLIFDEVKTCGKYYGGSTERFGVVPDLKVLGKAIGGGLPLSAVAGKREILEEVVPGVVAHAGTFNSNPLAITAGHITLSKILTREAMARVSLLNSRLGRAYADLVSDNHLQASVAADGLSGVLSFSDRPIRNWREFQKSDVGKWSLYYLMMMNRGVIPAGTGPDEQWTISVQHSHDDIEKHIETFKEVAPLLRGFTMEVPIVEAI